MGKKHHVWVNQRTKLPFSIAMLVYQKVSKVPLQSTFAYYMLGTIDESNSLFEEKHC